MNRDVFTHETTFTPCDSMGNPVGDIDVRITYVVLNFGCPARIRYDENDHPAEPAEVDVVHVEMLNAPKAGREAVYIDAWDWLFDWVYDWCDEYATELAGQANLEIAAE